MPTLSPLAFPLDGTETVELNVAGRGGTITLAQLRQAVRGQPIGAGAPNPPVGQPAIASVAGTEQVAVFNGATGGYAIVTLGQLIAWATTGTLPAFALHASGGGLGMAPAAALADVDAVSIRQAGGIHGLTLAIFRAWLTAA